MNTRYCFYGTQPGARRCERRGRVYSPENGQTLDGTIVSSALRYSAPGCNADVLAADLAQQIKDGKTVSNSDIGRSYPFMLTEANANKFVDSFDLLDSLVPDAKQTIEY